jgi:hypothetical protein
MKFAWSLAALLVMNCSSSWAQGVYYGAYYAPTPVVVTQQTVVAAPVYSIAQIAYVQQPVVAYASPVYVPTQIYSAPAVVAAPGPLMHMPYSVAASETSRLTRNGVNYAYREYGPLGGQRYHYTVHSRPHGYVVRERGH